MDSVADPLAQGRTFRVLTVIDEYTRECLAIETVGIPVKLNAISEEKPNGIAG